MKPFIARDTGEPLVVMGGYQVAENGGIMHRTIPPAVEGQDTGADPLGDGKFRMYPSGEIVDYEERCRRLKR